MEELITFWLFLTSLWILLLGLDKLFGITEGVTPCLYSFVTTASFIFSTLGFVSFPAIYLFWYLVWK